MNDSTPDSPTVQIPLGNDHFAIVDSIDADVARYYWHHGDGYAVNGTTLMHRLILSRVVGRLLERDELVDHKDRNGLNNTRSNLRIATRAQNGQNRKVHKNNKSGYKGVTYYKSRNLWRASITVDGKCKTLGYYDTPEMAGYSYNQGALQYFGEFAKLNELPDSFNPALRQPRPMGRPKSAKPKQPRRKTKGSRGPNSLNKSGYKGVTFHKRNNTWYAHIYLNGNDVHLGTFSTAKEAAIAFNEASLKAYGLNAFQNAIEE
jgi:hypothetical protein